MSDDLEVPIKLDDLADILSAPGAEVLRLTRRGVLTPNADGDYPLRTSILAYTRHWVDITKAVRKLIATATGDESTAVSADFLAERLMLDVDEVWHYATAGVFPCDDDGRFPLAAALRGFTGVCAERMAGVARGRSAA